MDSPSLGGEAHDPLIGEMIGRYRVEKKIGQGGMGSVYELLQPAIHKRMALKLLHEEYASREEIVKRFFDEARAVNLIGHPSIVDITDFSHLPDGRPFIIMEFLQGESLEDYLSDKGALGEAETLDILKQICSALGAAHSKHIVHRDLKPENIFLVRHPHQPMRVKVLDFGIAKLRDKGTHGAKNETQTGVVLGTPTYMSPEQAQGNTTDADHRTDIYSLGAMLFQMLTGAPPFAGKTFASLIFKHISEAPPKVGASRPDIAPAWTTIVDTALSKSPEDRYQSMQALLDDAQEAVPQAPLAATNIKLEPAPPTPAAASVTLEEHTKKSPPLVPLIAAVALLGGAGAWFATRGGASSDVEPKQGPTVVSISSEIDAGETATRTEKLAEPQAQPTTAVTSDASTVAIVPPDAAVPVAEPATEEPTEATPTASEEATSNRPRARGKATLTVLSNHWAYVSLDGKQIGTTPIQNLSVPSGSHKLKLKNGSTGETKTYRLQLKKSTAKKLRHDWP